MTSQINIESSTPKQKQQKGIGSWRSVEQVYDTFMFEVQRNIKRALILLGVIGAFFALNYYLAYRNEQIYGENAFPTVISYISQFTGILSFLILILGVGFGGQMLVVDFQQETGNILFPKISRGRLFLGRLLANYGMIAVELIIYYLAIAAATLLKFDSFPKEFWYSLGWALLYALMVLSMATLFSSFMGKTSSVVVTILLLMLIGFSMVEGIVSLVSQAEPLYLPNYYSRIISSSLNMPDERKIVQEINQSEMSFSVTTWITPSPLGATIGLLVQIILYLGLGYYFYRRRQNN